MPTADEDKFILHWRAASTDGVLTQAAMLAYKTCWLGQWDRFEADLLLRWADSPDDVDAHGPSVLVPTPRGADLLATADAIGYDPTAKPDPAPKMQPCPDCNGVGRKPLGVARMGADPEHVCELDYTCTTCEGLREVPDKVRGGIAGYSCDIEIWDDLVTDPEQPSAHHVKLCDSPRSRVSKAQLGQSADLATVSWQRDHVGNWYAVPFAYRRRR